MLASERSLASAHQPLNQSQRRAVQGISKPRNGKSVARPVKIYVIDPRTLQQRLEAFVGQKNQKQEQAQAKQKEKNDKLLKQQSEEIVEKKATKPNITAPKTPVNPPPPKPKVLPVIVPKYATIGASTPASTSVGQDTLEVLGSGVSLQCIDSATGYSLPVVVTNGVALLQQPSSSQSSMPSTGVFLPGVTAIPSVIPQVKHKPKPPPKKKKGKKRKRPKKRKLTEDNTEKDDEEVEAEFAYLLKETTTRTGRLSRPVTQPNPPAITAPSVPVSGTKTTSPPTNSGIPTNVKKKVPPLPELIPASQMFFKKAKFASSIPECTQLPSNQDTSQIQTSTNGQGPLEPDKNSGLSNNTNTNEILVFKINAASTTENTNATSTSSSVIDGSNVLLQVEQGEESSLVPQAVPFIACTEISRVHDESNVFLQNNNPEASSTIPQTIPFNACSEISRVQDEPNVLLQVENTEVSPTISETIPFTSYIETPESGNHCFVSDFYPKSMSKFASNSIYSDSSVTHTNVSLVPNVLDEPVTGYFSQCISSNVDVVPSYSIPNSPPSLCQSPGLPDIIDARNDLYKDNDSPRPACHSPIDPMLLHSRSPFPPPIPDVSMHSVSASNLSIPEESLCKGELFMDLGDGILDTLDNPCASRLSSPFCNDSSVGKLFSDSSQSQAPAENELSIEASEDRNSQPLHDFSPSSVTPVLLATTEDANDGEIFQTTNFARNFVQPTMTTTPLVTLSGIKSFIETRNINVFNSGTFEFPKLPYSVCPEGDLSSVDSTEIIIPDPDQSESEHSLQQRSIWNFVQNQIKSFGISQACGEISEMADKLSRIARDQFIPVREEEIERLGNSVHIIHVDTPFFSHLLDLPFGSYVFKEDAGRRLAPPPPPSSELSFTGGVDDVEKFLPPDIDLISLPHLTNLDLV